MVALAAIPLAVHAFLAWRLRAPGISTGQDDAVYLLLGRGLWELGYSNYWLPGNPIQGTYPPLYPLMLGLTGGIFGDTMTPVLILNILLSTLALGLLFSIAWRWSPPAAFLALSVSAVNPWLVRMAGQMYTEPVYLFCTVLTLWFLAVPAATTRSRFGAGAMAIAAFLTRAVGVSMIAAVLITWLIERRHRAVLIFGVVSLICVGGWSLRAGAATGAAFSGQSYIADALSPNYRAPPDPESAAPAPTPATPDSPTPSPPPVAATDSSPAAPSPAAPSPAPEGTGNPRGLVTSVPALASVIVQRVLANIPDYLSRRVPSVLAFPTIPGTTLDNWLWLVLIAGLGGLGLLELGRRLPGAAIYLGCYGGILLVWPFSLPRYLAPVIPYLVLVLFLGFGRLLGQRAGPRAWALPSILALVLVVSGFRLNGPDLSAMARCDRTAPYTSEGCYNPVERAFFAAVRQADQEAPADALVMSPKMATLYLLTGRRSVDVMDAARLGPEELRRHLNDAGVRYVLLSRIHIDQKFLGERLQAFCGDWELRGEYAGGALLLRRIEEQAAEPARATCEAVSRLTAGPW